ncbi:YrdB family protein [Streptomyces sp. NPDC088762]|uniref:YrdB family protein n=1 Tax=Streptomyces sp. NPDC088762 TaxID=3365891 RepID=UPI0037F75164
MTAPRRRSAFGMLNDLLAFLLEVFALLGLALWGYRQGGGMAGGVLLGTAAAAAAALLWGAFAAPKARYRVPLPAVLAVKAVVFGAAALALVGLGLRSQACWFAAIVFVNTALVTYYRSRDSRA